MLIVSLTLNLKYFLIPYTANRSRWKSFAVFMDQSVLQFSSEIACAVGFGNARPPSNRFPANYNLVLQPQNFSTSNNLQYMVSKLNLAAEWSIKLFQMPNFPKLQYK